MKIAIITGGETGEREVSILSARNVADVIDFAETKTFVFPEEKEEFMTTSKDFDLVIPMIHGRGAEDGSLQGLLEHLGLPYIFSGITTHAIAIDKTYTKEIVSTLGILSPENIDSFPAFVKPRNGGSSVASRLCDTSEEYEKIISENPRIEFMKEKPAKGREFTVGVIEHDGEVRALPVVEIIPKGAFFDFENKYDPEKLATEVCPAVIENSLSDELRRQALLVHTHLGVRHMSRSDFIVTDEGEIFFLEINTIPGMTATSLIPKMLVTAGISIRELLNEWCQVKGGI